MKVTDKNLSFEPKLIKMLDLMINRMTGKNKMDNVLLIDGDEGYGKSNIGAGIGYYIHHKTERPFTLNNLFFDLEKLIRFAIETEKQIIIWDEAALGGLAQEWWNKNQRKFIKLLMIARKRQHFFIICIPKFFKLNEYIVLDRAIALIHVYARKETDLGRFVYFKKKNKEKLYFDWRKKRARNYKSNYNIHGTFGEYLPKVFSQKEYDKKKDIAIMSIDKEDDKMDSRQYRKHLIKIYMQNLETLGIKLKQTELSQLFGMSLASIENYVKENRKTLTPNPQLHI